MSKFVGLAVIVLFGVFWCGIVFLCDAVFCWNASRQLRAYGYAETAGVVTHSEVKVDHDSDGSSHKPEVWFRFEVGGKEYEAHRPRYDFVSFGKERSYEVVRNYPVGQAVTVYYNPAAPNDAVLERGIDLGSFFGFLFLAPFNAVAFGFVGGFGVWLRGKKLGRPVLGVAVRDDGLNTLIRIYDISPTFAALAGWGGAGFLSTFAVLGASWIMPFESAIALGWSATAAATFLIWRSARKKYIEIRRDCMLGNVTLRERDGVEFAVQPGDLRPGKFSRRMEKDSDGDAVEKFTPELPFFDRAGDQPRILKLPDQSTEEEVVKYLAWLNGVLGFETANRDESAAILER